MRQANGHGGRVARATLDGNLDQVPTQVEDAFDKAADAFGFVREGLAELLFEGLPVRL